MRAAVLVLAVPLLASCSTTRTARVEPVSCDPVCLVAVSNNGTAQMRFSVAGVVAEVGPGATRIVSTRTVPTQVGVAARNGRYTDHESFHRASCLRTTPAGTPGMIRFECRYSTVVRAGAASVGGAGSGPVVVPDTTGRSGPPPIPPPDTTGVH